MHISFSYVYDLCMSFMFIETKKLGFFFFFFQFTNFSWFLISNCLCCVRILHIVSSFNCVVSLCYALHEVCSVLLGIRSMKSLQQYFSHQILSFIFTRIRVSTSSIVTIFLEKNEITELYIGKHHGSSNC